MSLVAKIVRILVVNVCLLSIKTTFQFQTVTKLMAMVKTIRLEEVILTALSFLKKVPKINNKINLHFLLIKI